MKVDQRAWLVIEPADLLKQNGLVALGPYGWGSKCAPDEPGVYLISVTDPGGVWLGAPSKGSVSEERLEAMRLLWRGDEAIVYIGRASKSLRRRLTQFFGHRYGHRSPHAGGQSILLIRSPLLIHCVTVSDPAVVEHRLISEFERVCRRKPFGNKVKAARVNAAATGG